MNGIDNIIAQLEEQTSAVERALETLRDFDQTGSVTPGKIHKLGMWEERWYDARRAPGAGACHQEALGG